MGYQVCWKAEWNAPRLAACRYAQHGKQLIPMTPCPLLPCEQMNERYLRWDASAQRQLIMIWVAQQLDVPMAELEGAAGWGGVGWGGAGALCWFRELI